MSLGSSKIGCVDICRKESGDLQKFRRVPAEVRTWDNTAQWLRLSLKSDACVQILPRPLASRVTLAVTSLLFASVSIHNMEIMTTPTSQG